MVTFPRRGEIWLAILPDEQKARPVLVISTDGRNERSTNILAVPITTNLTLRSTHVLLPAGTAGLSYDSVARCENVQYALKSRLTRGPLGGTLRPALMRDVEDALLLSLGIIR